MVSTLVDPAKSWKKGENSSLSFTSLGVIFWASLFIIAMCPGWNSGFSPCGINSQHGWS